MLDLIIYVYNTAFTIFFVIVNSIILVLVVQKVFDFLFSREEKINGSYALITGCDTGFGNATTYELNKRDIHVFAACLTSDAVQRFDDDDNFKGTAFLMNVTKKEDIEKAKNVIKDVVKEKGLQLLFNNAGVFTPGPIEWMSEEDMRMPSEINLWGAINVTKAMLPLIKKARGRIVNTTSVAGRIAVRNLSSYHISKYAFEAFSDCLRYEMKPWGVSVHIIEPGVMQTNLYNQVKNRWQRLWDIQPKEMQEAYGEEYITKILDTADDVIARMAGNPNHVIQAYLHAALSTRPKLRYLVGADAHFMAMTMGLLPTFMGDFVHGLIIPTSKPAAGVV